MKVRKYPLSVRFGRNLKFLRERKNETQMQLANALGVREVDIQAFESGEAEPNHSLLISISHYFKICIQHLIELDLTVVDTFRSKSVLKIDNFNYDYFLETTSEAQLFLEGVLNNPEFTTFVNKISNGSRQDEISELIKILELLLQNNWKLINMIKEYYRSLDRE